MPDQPSSKPAAEREEDARPVLVEVTPHLFFGNAVAASDGDLLHRNGITQVLNLAVNVDLAPIVLPDGAVVRHAKIGLIDGPGNAPAHLAAAALAIGGMLAQKAPGKPSYPDHREGGLLVHCRGGRSRSAAAIALHLALEETRRFPDLDIALNHVRALRGLPQTQPCEEMIALAFETLALLDPLRPSSARPEVGVTGMRSQVAIGSAEG